MARGRGGRRSGPRRGGRRGVKIEWLIAFYLFISVMMTVFNFGYLAYEKVHAKRFDARTKRFAVRCV